MAHTANVLERLQQDDDSLSERSTVLSDGRSIASGCGTAESAPSTSTALAAPQTLPDLVSGSEESSDLSSQGPRDRRAEMNALRILLWEQLRSFTTRLDALIPNNPRLPSMASGPFLHSLE